MPKTPKQPSFQRSAKRIFDTFRSPLSMEDDLQACWAAMVGAPGVLFLYNSGRIYRRFGAPGVLCAPRLNSFGCVAFDSDIQRPGDIRTPNGVKNYREESVTHICQ